MDRFGLERFFNPEYRAMLEGIMANDIIDDEIDRLLLNEDSSNTHQRAENSYGIVAPVATMETAPPAIDGASSASHHEEQSSVPTNPITLASPNATAATCHDEEQEECEICWELAPKSSFVTLPCDHGHRFMKECIARWGNELTKDWLAYCHCPKCRQEFRYDICGHYLERSRLQSDERGLLVYDLAMNYCMCCRESERRVRRRKYKLLVQAGQNPNWTAFQPGDLFFATLLERDTPPHLKEKYKEVQEDHREKIELYRDEAAFLDKENLVEGTLAFRRYWELRSRIADYDRAKNSPNGVYDGSINGVFLNGEYPVRSFSHYNDEDFEDSDDEEIDFDEDVPDSDEDDENEDDGEDHDNDDSQDDEEEYEV